MKDRIYQRWTVCRVQATLDDLWLVRAVHWLRRVLLTAEQTARAVWYFVAGVPG
jgi:hypothetical protein